MKQERCTECGQFVARGWWIGVMVDVSCNEGGGWRRYGRCCPECVDRFLNEAECVVLNWKEEGKRARVDR